MGLRIHPGIRAATCALAILLAACGSADPDTGPAFRVGAPSVNEPVTGSASASVGVLSGKLFTAYGADLDPATNLPRGYGPLQDDSAVVTVRTTMRLFGKPSNWSGRVASAAYTITGLPLGVPLEVTASSVATQPRTLTITMPPSGRYKLDFEYEGGQGDSYLLPQPGAVAP